MLQYIISHQALWLPAPSSQQENQDDVTCFERLHIPSGRHPLEGLWKGTFGGHGIEILTLELSEDGQMLQARKVGCCAAFPVPLRVGKGGRCVWQGGVVCTCVLCVRQPECA